METETVHTAEWRKNNQWFHALAHRCGMDKEDIQATIYSYYSKVSTTELSARQIYTLCRSLQNSLSDQEKELDKWRKRVMGVVRKFCVLMSYMDDDKYVISIITRGGKDFNQMSKSELIAKYNAFNKQVRELKPEYNPILTVKKTGFINNIYQLKN